MKKRQCKHKWNVADPQPSDAYCTECGILYTGKGKNQRKSITPAGNVLAEVAGELAGMVAATGPDPTPAKDFDGYEITESDLTRKPPLSVVQPPAPPPTWCKMAGKRISQAYVLLIEGACARFAKRQTAEPEGEDVTELGNALGEQMAIWFPDSEMTPLAKIGIAAASVAATMAVGSKPIKPPVQSVTSIKVTGDAAPPQETATVSEPLRPTGVALPRGVF